MRYSFLRKLALISLFSITIAQSALAGLIRDTELETGLQTLAAPLMRAAGYAPDAISIRIIIDSSYNAFVAGERVIFIHSGLLLNAQSAEEILGVIAHELGHLKAGHVPRLDEAQQQASGAAALATIAAMAIAAGGSDAATGVLIGGIDRANRVFLTSVRRNESVADEIGLALMDKAALSSVGLRNVMQRLARQRALPESRQSVYYSTHPGAVDRLQALQDHVNQSPHSAQPAPSDAVHLYNRIATKLYAWTEAPQRVLDTGGDRDQGAAHNSGDRRYAMAIAAYRQGDLTAALDHMDNLVAVYPQDPYFHEFRGDVLFALARPADAAAALERALQFRPDSPLVQLTLGRALVATGDATQLPRAIESLAAARAGEPLWAFPARQHAIALGRAGQIAAADIALAEEAILHGDNQLAVQLARRAISRDVVDPALLSRANDIIFRYSGASD